jgi:hypothetical protein
LVAGHILPVAEKTYRRLLMLMNVMTSNLPHTAGLNPKGNLQVFRIRSVINWPHGSGSVSRSLLFKEISEKIQHFIKFNDLIPI